jgi:hypothetical protein
MEQKRQVMSEQKMVKIFAKEDKGKLIKWAIKFKGGINSFNGLVGPCMVLLAFIIVIPTINRAFAWIFAFMGLLIALEMSINQIEKVWKKEVKAEELIQANRDMIEELLGDIESLEKKIKKKEELNSKKKILKEVNK